jgi:hypothetical protein
MEVIMASVIKTAWNAITNVGGWIWDGVKQVYEWVSGGDGPIQQVTQAATQISIQDTIQQLLQGLIPQLLAPILDKFNDVLANVSSLVTKPLENWGIKPPQAWYDILQYISAAPSKVLNQILGLKEMGRPEDFASAAGLEYVQRTTSSRFIHDAINSVSYQSVMNTDEIRQYIVALHESHVDVSPVLPPNMPDIPNIIFNPPGHPFGLNWLGIPQINETIEGISHGILMSISYIKDIFIHIWNWLTETITKSINVIITGISNIGQWIAEGFTRIGEIIWNSIKEGAKWVVDGLYAIWTHVAGWVQAVVNWVHQILTGAYNWVWQTITTVWTWVVNHFYSIVNIVEKAILSVVDVLTDSFNWVINMLGNLRTNIWDAITVQIPNFFSYLWQQMKQNFWDLLSDVKNLVIDIKEHLSNLFAPVINRIQNIGSYLWQALKDFWQWIYDWFKNDIYPTLKEYYIKAKEEITEKAIAVNDYVELNLKQFAPMTPEKVPKLALEVLGTCMGFGLLAHLTSITVEAIYPTKELGLHYLAGFFGDLGNFGGIGAAIMGTLITVGIKQSMTYHYSNLLRPNILDERTLAITKSKREINDVQFEQTMRYHGYPEALIESQKNIVFRDPRLTEVFRVLGILSPPVEITGEGAQWLAKANIVPENQQNWWIYAKLGKYGLSDEDLDFIAKAVSENLKKYEQSLFIGRVRDLFKEGLISEEEAVSQLAHAGLRDDVITYRVQGMKLEYNYNRAKELKDNTVYQFRNDLISEDDFRDMLDGAGYTPDSIDLVVNTEKIRRLPKLRQEEKKEAAKAVAEMQKMYKNLYRELYRSGLIDADTYHSDLLAIGITDTMASLTVSIEQARMYISPQEQKLKESESLFTAVMRQKVAKYKLLFKAQMLTKNQLIAYLVIVGVHPTLATAIADTEEARMFSPPLEEPES